MPAITRELLEKFWSGLCTEEEALLVEAYFAEHPEDESLLEEFEATGEQPLPEGDSAEMRAMVVRATRPKTGFSIGRVTVALAAASLLVVYVLVWLYQRGEKGVAGGPAPQKPMAWLGKHNAGSKPLRVALPDSTETILSPGATLLCRRDFGSYDKREVKVEGQVVFSVRRNKQMPFIVYSEGIRTTVLGTIFEVSNVKDSPQVKVRLLQGKVMVGVENGNKQYYLKPGEELVYGRWDKSIAVHDFRKGSGYTAHRATRLPGKPDSLANWYMFNNQGLADVFDQLAIIYNVEIQYSHADLRNKYFIGKLEKKDSLNKILRDIALLNHLSIIERDGCYVIRKRKQ
jgi:ferric-dicitrate binding protein FerR (iron transport regulator)